MNETANTPTKEERKTQIAMVAGGIVFLLVIIAVIYFLLLPDTPTDRIRDITIIFLAVEGLLIGIAAVVLIVQIARLANLLQNEIKPVLEAANDTMNTVRGTAEFLSANLVDPVVKVSGFFAMFQRVTRFFDELIND